MNNEEALGDECEEEQTVKMTEHEVYKDELKKYSEMKSNIETEYFRCEKELRDKTEENEKLKIEVNDLKQILKLKDELHENGLDEPIVEKADIIIIEEKSTNVKNNLQKKVSSRKTKMLNCSICIFQCTTNVQLNNHKGLKHPVQKNKDEQLNNKEEDVQKTKDKQFNCEECDFQGTSKLQLNKHTDLKHVARKQRNGEEIKCRNCNEQFSQRWDLMNHHKQKHTNTVAFCRNKLEGKCPFSDQMCWWNHHEVQNVKNSSFECYICNENFDTHSNLMKHRKINHPGVIKKCLNFLQNKCRFQNTSCWFSHDEDAMETDEEGFKDIEENVKEKTENNEENQANKSVFQKAFRNIKPPINKQKID